MKEPGTTAFAVVESEQSEPIVVSAVAVQEGSKSRGISMTVAAPTRKGKRRSNPCAHTSQGFVKRLDPIVATNLGLLPDHHRFSFTSVVEKLRGGNDGSK